MKSKQKPEEFRMMASDFDRMMRHALGAPPLALANKTAKGKRKRKVNATK